MGLASAVVVLCIALFAQVDRDVVGPSDAGVNSRAPRESKATLSATLRASAVALRARAAVDAAMARTASTRPAGWRPHALLRMFGLFALLHGVPALLALSVGRVREALLWLAAPEWETWRSSRRRDWSVAALSLLASAVSLPLVLHAGRSPELLAEVAACGGILAHWIWTAVLLTHAEETVTSP